MDSIQSPRGKEARRMKRILSSAGLFYRNLRIKHKLFLLLFFIMAICIVLTYGVLQYAYSIYDHQLYQRSSQVLNLSSNSIENELRRVENTTFNIVTDPTIQNKLTIIKNDPSETNYERHQLRDEMVVRLVQFAGAEKYAVSADMIDLSGNIYSAGRVAAWSEDVKKEIWEEAIKGEGKMRWIYPKTPDPSLLAVRLVRSYYSYLSLDLETLGVLVLRVRLNEIVEDVASGTELGSGELLITAGQQPVYPIHEAQGPHIQSVFDPVSSGYEIRDDGDHKVFISQMNSGYTGWTYSSIIPFDTIFERIVWMKNLLIIVFSVSLLVMIALAFRVARGITVPMEELISRMKQVQKGDFITPVLPDPTAPAGLPKDEVGQLHRTFRMMIQQIDELIHENYAKQLTIKETQFKALQAQINPHFLYNTLESINWEAKVGGQTRISQMVESLGFLLRSSISQKESIVTVGQELDIMRHYLTIQQTRFEERLVFRLEVPQHVYSCPLPKLTLQPLVENAIHHALEPMVEPCHITIRSMEKDDGVLLIVEDDGPGMIPELLEQVQRGEVRSKGNGIGLSNIRERIVLAFGEPYGLHIESEPEQGTRVIVHIPYERGDSNV
jgi:two-component system, sensor histidine kinase YesM